MTAMDLQQAAIKPVDLMHSPHRLRWRGVRCSSSATRPCSCST